MAYNIYLITTLEEDVGLDSNIGKQHLLDELSPTWRLLRKRYNLYYNDGRVLPLLAIDECLVSLKRDIQKTKTKSKHPDKGVAIDYLSKVVKLVEKYKAKGELDIKALTWW